MNKEATPESPEASQPPEPQNHVQVELQFDMRSTRLSMKSKAPTIVIMGVLSKAQAVTPAPLAQSDPSGARVVRIDFDLDKEVCNVESDASPLVYAGILAMAHSMITQNQVLQAVQAIMTASRGNPSTIHRPS